MRKNALRTKKITFLALFASLALLLSYVEMLLPPIFTAVPGIKMGLPNIIIIIIVVFLRKKKEDVALIEVKNLTKKSEIKPFKDQALKIYTDSTIFTEKILTPNFINFINNINHKYTVGFVDGNLYLIKKIVLFILCSVGLQCFE